VLTNIIEIKDIKMKKILLSTVLVLGMMTLTTGCSDHMNGAKKCGASGKCNKGKCGSK